MVRFLKSVAFALTPVFFLFGFTELGLGLVGVAPIAEGDDPYVGFERNLPLYVPAEGDGDVPAFELAAGRIRFFNPARFSETKSESVRRIFCVGGSTTYGRPYRDLTSFCGWLRATLAALAPGSFEVINAGGISYASYRVAEVVRQITQFQPDAVIVYTGHNEFLEDRTYSGLRDRSRFVRRAHQLFGRTRVFSALRRLAWSTREELPAEVETRLDNSIGLDAYNRDDAWSSAVVTHFRLNLERILDLTRAAGAVPIGVVPADNLRSCSPFKSEHDPRLTDSEREHFGELLAVGVSAFRDGDLTASLRNLEEATSIAPRHAHARYWLGRALIGVGELEVGALELVRARDEDVCPLRATSKILEVTRSVYRAQGVATIDFPAVLAAKSQDESAAAPGEEWFLDHVHPNLEGHRVLARELLDRIKMLRWLPPGTTQDTAAIAQAEAAIRDQIDHKENGRSLRNLAKVLSWAGKNEDAARAAREAVALLGRDAESLFILSLDASDRGDHIQAIALLREALRAEPDWVKARHNLGVELARAGRDEDALVEYDQVLELAPDHPGVHYNRGNALERLGRVEEAARAYERAVEIDPMDAAAVGYLAELRTELAGTLGRRKYD